MAERAKRKIGRWVAGALCALLVPLALAQPRGGAGFGAQVSVTASVMASAPARAHTANRPRAYRYGVAVRRPAACAAAA
jgi:hypothetical protein